MIFQQPQSSLNPVQDVGRQIAEVLELHRGMKHGPARERALEMLKMVGIPDPERRIKSFPHEMSGGMAQRVMIAMAAGKRGLLIADEQTTALASTIRLAFRTDAASSRADRDGDHPDHPTTSASLSSAIAWP